MGVSGVNTVSLSKTRRHKEKRQQLFHQEEQRQQTLPKEEPKQPTSAAWHRVEQKQQDQLQDQQQQLQRLEQLPPGPDCAGEIFLVQLEIDRITRVNTWMAADKAAGCAPPLFWPSPSVDLSGEKGDVGMSHSDMA